MKFKDYILESNAIRLWLDDERDPKDTEIKSLFGSRGDELWVKTAQEAIDILKSGNVSFISLDHDLGDPKITGDGYEVAKWIEEHAFNGTIRRLDWLLHSKNDEGVRRMSMALNNADRYWDRQEENGQAS